MAIRAGSVAALVAALVLAPGGRAEEVPGPVRDAVRSILGDVEGDAVRTAPLPGWYEVRSGRDVFYISVDAAFLFHGDLYALAERRNLTEEARREGRRDLLRRMEEDSLIVFAATTRTRHRLTVFTDVDCPYCAKLHLEVPELNARGVEVRYAAWPRTPPGTESYGRSVSVWCARDRLRAMTDAKAGREVARATCDNPVDRHVDLGRRLGVTGTPALFTEDGGLISGYVPYRELVRRLDDEG